MTNPFDADDQASHATGYYPALDGLRAIAIGLVLLIHFGSRVRPVDEFTAWIRAICNVGWVGVDVFFCISGLLITRALLDRRGQPGYFKNFYARRSLRIFPLYFGVLLIAFVIAPIVAGHAIEAKISSVWLWTYTSNFLLAQHGPTVMRGDTLNFAHFWSLAIEEQFYLIWPLVVSLLTTGRLQRLCLVGIALGTPTRIAFLLAMGSYAPYYMTVCRIDSLLAGAWLAISLSTDSAEATTKTARKVGLVSCVVLIAWFVITGNLFCFDPVVSTIAPVAVAGVSVWLVSLAIQGDSRFARLLSHPALQSIGRVSYGIYVYHGLLQLVFPRMIPYLLKSSSGYWTLFFTLMTLSTVSSYLLARASYVVESQFLKLKKHFD